MQSIEKSVNHLQAMTISWLISYKHLMLYTTILFFCLYVYFLKCKLASLFQRFGNQYEAMGLFYIIWPSKYHRNYILLGKLHVDCLHTATKSSLSKSLVISSIKLLRDGRYASNSLGILGEEYIQNSPSKSSKAFPRNIYVHTSNIFDFWMYISKHFSRKS